MKCFIYFSILAASALAAPQTISSHSSQTLRSALGRASVTSSSKTVDTPHSHSHGHETRVNNDPIVHVVSRPRVVQQLSSGPFIVRDSSGNAPFLFDDSIESPFIDSPLRSPALVPAPANPAGHSLFQTADGRFFALSTAANTIQPGQIFRTSDGRIFTTAVEGPAQSGSLFDQQQADGGDGATVIETGRDAQRNVANAVEAEQEREDLEEAVAAATEDIEAEEVEEPVTKAPAPSRAINRVKTVTKVRTNAGFTPASTNLFSAANPGVFRAVAAVPNVRHEFVAAGPHLAVAPSPIRTAIVQRGPLAYSLAGDVSSGFYSYPGLGVAYDF